MRLKLLITAYVFIIGSLPLNHAGRIDIPGIVLPERGHPNCVIGQDCDRYDIIMNNLIWDINNERSKISAGRYSSIPTAANMLYLEKDRYLEARAQEYVQSCLRRNSCPYQQGQSEGDMIISIKQFPTSTDSAADSRLREAITSWALNVIPFGRERLLRFINSYSQKEDLRNFAVFAHALNWKVGCGFADIIISYYEFKEVLVCIFGPSKLTVGEEIYKANLPPCSLCPEGSICYYQETDQTFNGILCEMKNDSFPVHVAVRSHSKCDDSSDNGQSWWDFCETKGLRCVADDTADEPTCDCGIGHKFIEDECRYSKCDDPSGNGLSWWDLCKTKGLRCVADDNADKPTCDCGIGHKFIEDECRYSKYDDSSDNGLSWCDLCKTKGLRCVANDTADEPTCVCGIGHNFIEDECRYSKCDDSSHSGQSWSQLCQDKGLKCVANSTEDKPTCDCGNGYKFIEDECRPDQMMIILPMNGVDQCFTTEVDCKQYLQKLQSYTIHLLNMERFMIGSRHESEFPAATNMLYLEYKPVLAEKAQKYAESCAQEHGVDESCLQLEENVEGEVITFIENHSMDTSANAETRISNAIMKWHSQISNISEIEISSFVQSYKQAEVDESLQTVAKLLNANVWKVGCGIADISLSTNQFKEVISCFYGSPKLEDGKKLYIPGDTPCSHCPKGTSCLKNEWEGLEVSLCNKTATKNEHSFWECRVRHYSDECTAEHLCSPHWTINRIDGYKSIDVSGTCIAATIFEKEIPIENPSCFKFQYIKEENHILSFNSSIIGFAAQVNTANGFSTSVNEMRDTNQWSDIHLNIPWSGVKVQVGIVVRSHSDSNDKQTIKVRRFQLHNSRCA